MATRDPLGEVLQDLRDEYERLDEIFSALSFEQWPMPSGAPGRSILDVVVHLGVSEEGVASSIATSLLPQRYGSTPVFLQSPPRLLERCHTS